MEISLKKLKELFGNDTTVKDDTAEPEPAKTDPEKKYTQKELDDAIAARQKELDDAAKAGTPDPNAPKTYTQEEVDAKLAELRATPEKIGVNPAPTQDAKEKTPKIDPEANPQLEEFMSKSETDRFKLYTEAQDSPEARAQLNAMIEADTGGTE